MAQWIKASLQKPDNLSLIPEPAWWKEKADSIKSSDLHTCYTVSPVTARTRARIHTHRAHTHTTPQKPFNTLE